MNKTLQPFSMGHRRAHWLSLSLSLFLSLSLSLAFAIFICTKANLTAEENLVQELVCKKHLASIQIEIDKIHVDSAITIEMVPFENDKIYVFLLDHEYIPTITKFEHSAIFSLKDSYEAGLPNTSALWNR